MRIRINMGLALPIPDFNTLYFSQNLTGLRSLKYTVVRESNLLTDSFYLQITLPIVLQVILQKCPYLRVV